MASAAPALAGGAAAGRNMVPLRQQIFAAMAVPGCSCPLAWEQGKAQPSPAHPVPAATAGIALELRCNGEVSAFTPAWTLAGKWKMPVPSLDQWSTFDVG